MGCVSGVENAACTKLVAVGPLGEMNPLATIVDGRPHMPNAIHVDELG